MLGDPAAASRWREALALVDSAAAEGEPDAIERRALFECMGVGRPPDWGKALDSLAEAAQRGSAAAGRQLVLLADDRIQGSPAIAEWHEVRSRVTIEERLRRPAAQTLSANPLVRTIEGFLSAAQCRWLIEASAPRLTRAVIYSKETGEAGIDPGRTNQFALFNLADLDCVIEWIRARISTAIGAPLPCLEVSQVLRYRPGEEFAPHCDYLDPVTMGEEITVRGQRAATVLIYLNDDFSGGETSFPELGIEYRGRTGDTLLFSSLDPSGRPDPRTRHAGRPPTSGEKWLFSQWVRDRLPR